MCAKQCGDLSCKTYPIKIVINAFKTEPIIIVMAFDFRINQYWHRLEPTANKAPSSTYETIFIVLLASNIDTFHGCSMISDKSKVLKNIVDAITLMIAIGPLIGGSNFSNVNLAITQRVPEHTVDAIQRRNPVVSNSTSPNAVNSSPPVINKTTTTRGRVIFSIPNATALNDTNMGEEAFTMV